MLLVEDEMLIRWSVTQTLEGHGHVVLQAPDGRTALRLLNEAGPAIDVVLLDYRLPDSNGLEILAQVRALAPRSAILMMTAYGTTDVIERARAMGVHEVINKPFDLDHLEATVVAAAAHAARR